MDILSVVYINNSKQIVTCTSDCPCTYRGHVLRVSLLAHRLKRVCKMVEIIMTGPGEKLPSPLP